MATDARARALRWPLALLPAALLLQWMAACAPRMVESVYARRAYPAVRAVAALLTGRLPFALAEPLALALLVLAIALCVARGRRAAWRGRALLRTLGAAAAALFGLAGAVYLAFLLVWGLNYQRPRLAALAGLSAPGGSGEELRALSVELIAAANAARGATGDDAEGVLALPGGRRGTLDAADLGLRRASARLPALDGPRVRPKPALLSPVLSRLGIAGIFIPFTGEANVNAMLPAPDLPFAASHELAHQRGFAREDEANYIASVACRLHPGPEFRYAGLLISSLYVQSALAGDDRALALELEKARAPAVRRDLHALAEWNRRYASRVSRAAEQVNNAYLKSQGQALGVRSYGAVVDLLLAERRRALEAGPPDGGAWLLR